MNRSPLKFFLLVFSLSIPFWLMEPEDWPITSSVGVPFTAALILVYREEGLAGVRKLLGRIFDLGDVKKRIWYVPIVFLTPVLSLLAYGGMRLAGLRLSAEPYNLFVAIPLLFGLFFLLAIGEEVGWTGYVTDPLQERWNALATALILGVVTALWHLAPLIRMGRTPTWIVWWAVWSVPLRILIVWVYNNTAKSVFAAIVFHAMINLSASSPFIPRNNSPWDVAVVGVITVIAAAIVTLRWGAGTLARPRLR